MKQAKFNRAELVKELMSMRDCIDATLDLLLVDDDDDEPCEHPASAIEDISESLDDERYKCKACGEVRTRPFNEE